MKIYNDNCLKKLGDLPKNSINLFIIDLVNNKYDLVNYGKIKYTSKMMLQFIF